jgi:hypothetical protein
VSACPSAGSCVELGQGLVVVGVVVVEVVDGAVTVVGGTVTVLVFVGAVTILVVVEVTVDVCVVVRAGAVVVCVTTGVVVVWVVVGAPFETFRYTVDPLRTPPPLGFWATTVSTGCVDGTCETFGFRPFAARSERARSIVFPTSLGTSTLPLPFDTRS